MISLSPQIVRKNVRIVHRKLHLINDIQHRADQQIRGLQALEAQEAGAAESARIAFARRGVRGSSPSSPQTEGLVFAGTVHPAHDSRERTHRPGDRANEAANSVRDGSRACGTRCSGAARPSSGSGTERRRSPGSTGPAPPVARLASAVKSAAGRQQQARVWPGVGGTHPVFERVVEAGVAVDLDRGGVRPAR